MTKETVTCPTCAGQRSVPCWRCHGSGAIMADAVDAPGNSQHDLEEAMTEPSREECGQKFTSGTFEFRCNLCINHEGKHRRQPMPDVEYANQ